MAANDRQVGGNHYKTDSGSFEHWDIVAQFNLDYFQGQITKYVMRWKKKGGVADLQKAAHFLQKYIELETPPATEVAGAFTGDAVQSGAIFKQGPIKQY